MDDGDEGCGEKYIRSFARSMHRARERVSVVVDRSIRVDDGSMSRSVVRSVDESVDESVGR